MAKLSDTYTIGMSKKNEANGGGNTAPASYGVKLSERYKIGANTLQAPQVNFQKVPSVSAMAQPSTPTPTPSIDYNAIINEYESLPSTNVFSRLLSQDAKTAYNRKQELNPLYEQAKDAQTRERIAKLGLDEATVRKAYEQGWGYGGGQLTNLLKSKGVTDKKELDDLYRNIDKMLTRTAQTEATEKNVQFAGEHPVLGSALTIPGKALTGVGGVVETGVNYLAGNPLSNTSGSLAANKGMNQMRDKVSEDMSGLGKFAYGTGMSLADMFAARLMGSLPAILGAEKATDTMSESIDQGLNPGQIMDKGVLSGATTYLTEKLLTNNALDAAQEGIIELIKEGGIKALGKDGLKKIILPLLVKSGAAEGAQEGLENVADTLADVFIARGKNQLKQSYDQYKAEGLSDSQAAWSVARDKAVELGLDVAGGALSGFLAGGGEMGKAGIGYGINNRINNNTNIPKLSTPNNTEVKEEIPAVTTPTPVQEQQTVKPETITTPNVNTQEKVPEITKQNVNEPANVPQITNQNVNSERAEHYASENNRINAFLNKRGSGSIEMSNGQIIEHYTFKDMRSVLNEYKDNGVVPEDNQIAIKYNDGTVKVYSEGDNLDDLNLRNVSAIIWDNDSTTAYAGKGIKVENYDELDGWGGIDDWRVDFADENDVAERIPTPRTTERDQVMAEDIGLNDRSDEFYDGGDVTLTENVEDGIPHIPNIQRRNQYTSRAATNSFDNSGIFRQSEEYFNHMIERAKNDELQVDLKSMKQTNENTVEKLNEKGIDGVYKELMRKGVNTAEDVCASIYLMDAFIKNGDTVRADRLSRKVIDGQHNTGQTLQFMSAYTNTPAGMLQAMNALTGRETKLFIKEAKKSKLNNKKAKQFKQNGKLAAALSRIGYDGSMDKENVKTFKQILQEVKNTMSLESSSIQDDFTDADIEYLARLIEGGADVEELTNALTQHLATGFFTISQEDIQRINELYNLADNAKTSKERFEYQKQAAAVAAKYLGNASFMDKWNSWRYLAMLGNPRTMIRNVLGNKAFGAVTDIKDNVAAVLESMIIKDGEGRTKALLSKKKDADLLKAAENDFENYAYEHVAGSSKWTMKNTIENERQIFNNKALEWARTKTSDKLESDDLKAIKRKYKRALAGYLKANGANASEFNTDSALLQKARDYAIEEAKIATFHEDNSLADILNRASNAMRERGDFVGKAAEVAIESTIPFKKTPLNILKQGVVEYSPVSALKAVYEIATKQDASRWINDLSKGLTGSTILAIGWILGQSGLLVGQHDEDEEDLYNKGSNYSLKVNGKSFTLDWLAPAALPLFVGSELAKEFEGDSDKNILEILASIAEPAVEMSMLQGLDNVLSSLANTKGTKLAPTVANITAGYLSQAVPTLFGQVARTIDPYRRSTRTNDSAYTNPALAAVEKTGEKILNKLPGLSMLNQKYVDIWGNPQKNADGVPVVGGNVIGRAFQNFISPGYFNDVSMTDREQKLADLEKTFNENGYKGSLIPSVAKSNKPDGKRMSNSEYESYATTRGKELGNAIDTALSYKSKTTIPELQGYVNNIEDFANFVAQNKEFHKDVPNTYKKEYEAYKLGGYDGVMTYYMMNDQADSDGNGSVTQEEAANWLRKSNVPANKREAYFKIKFPKAKKIPKLK